MRTKQSIQGFTLIELLVVMGIFVVLAAIAFPFATGIKEGNKLMGCQANLRGIDRAVKLYHLDTGHYPPPVHTICYACSPPTDTDHWVAECPVCQEKIKLQYVGGLHVLVDGGYLKQANLACPSSPYDAGQPQLYTSYEDDDAEANLGTGAPKFIPNRIDWATAVGLTTTDAVDARSVPVYFRQLAPDAAAPPPWNGNAIEWYADESTVVTWCNYHAGTIKRDGLEQYLVLFLDGRVQMQNMTAIATGDASVDETWRATPIAP